MSLADVKLDNVLFINPFYHDKDMESFSNPIETDNYKIAANTGSVQMGHKRF